MNLYEYVTKHAIRGACTCGKCIDAPSNPEQQQPEGHTADLVFFKVAKTPEADLGDFLQIVKKEFPHWLNGDEHSYLEVGGNMGDQGIALVTMGLGYLLKAWDLLSPNSMFPDLDEELRKKLAGQGYITIKVRQ